MISTILSIIAIVISIIVAILDYWRELRINRTNLDSEYIKDIYKEHLVYKIPEARKYMNFDCSSKLIGTDKLIQELQQLRYDSLYFQYNNLDFYEELKKKLQQLEDRLVENTGKEFLGEEQTQLLTSIQEEINSIYKLISDLYLGKKIHKKRFKISIKRE